MKHDLNRSGLPEPETLTEYRIWDAYFTPAHSHPGRDGISKLVEEIELSRPAFQKAKFEKLCYFPHVGTGTTSDPALEQMLLENTRLITEPFRRWPGLLLGMMQLNANHLPTALEAVNRWMQNGPMVGVYFPGGGPGALTCSHSNFHPLVEAISTGGGLIMQHTWLKTGGKQGAGESTPHELAMLAKQYPEQPFICAHAGGEWEQGIRSVRDQPNVYIETSGFDATSGFLEMAVREVGAERILFGSHLPSRSLGTELGKVLGANLTEQEKKLILGENFRRLLAK